jgi:hypothetical protein
MSPNDILESIRPINPSAFGMTREQAMMMQQGQPMPQPPASSPMQGGLDMNQYLMQKVQDIKKRMGQDDMGALSNVTAAMPKPRMQGV